MKWIFKENAEPQESGDGFWYGINEGYIRPEELLDDKEQLEKLKEALSIVADFEVALIISGLLEEF